MTKKRPDFTESEGVTAFWISPRFKYPRYQNVNVSGIPSGDTQNTNSKLNEIGASTPDPENTHPFA